MIASGWILYFRHDVVAPIRIMRNSLQKRLLKPPHIPSIFPGFGTDVRERA
jgi:hypothetical protein